MLRIGNSAYIQETCEKLGLRPETVAVALTYTNLFFLRKSYLNYDRALVCCASMFIACKLLYEKMNIMLFCREYWQITHKGSICPPISEESRKQITENIFKIECDVLNTINFKLDLELLIPWP